MQGKTRRRFIEESFATLGAALVGGPAALVAAQPAGSPRPGARPAAPERPNVLLILTDQQRIDALGFRGRSVCRTPNLDRLAKEGISFDRAMTPTPICLPALTALFTSQYGHQTKTMSNSDNLETDPALLTRLKAKGYQIDFAGKWGMGKSVPSAWVDRLVANDRPAYSKWCLDQGLPDGWALNDPKTLSPRRRDVSTPRVAVNPIPATATNEAWTIDHALTLLDTRDRGRPFFLTCALNGPHPPFKIPEPYFSMYDPATIPQPPNFGPTPGEPSALGRSFYRTVFKDHGETWNAWRKTAAVYYGFATMVDAQIGRLIERVRQEGVLDRTLVIVSADHGEMLGQHGLWQKYHAYEEALRIPLIMRAPWLIDAGVRSTAPASLLDVAPTVLSACGAGAPSSCQGVDLSPAFSGPSAPTPRYLFSEFQPKADWHGVVDWRLVTDDRYKYVWNHGDIEECYDLASDPHELKNLAASPAHAPVVTRLRAELRDWMRRTHDALLPAFEQRPRASA